LEQFISQEEDMTMKLIKFCSLLAVAVIGMGATGCEAPVDLVGTYKVACKFKGPPATTANYYWQFFAEDPNVAGPTEFKSWEKQPDGTVKDLLSFYIYQKPVVTIKDPEEINNDKIYYVSQKDKDTLEFTGGEYSCTAKRSAIPYSSTAKAEL
jgi:hypothetical protein